MRPSEASVRLAAGTVLGAWAGPELPPHMVRWLEAGLGGVVLFGSNLPAGAADAARLAKAVREVRPNAVVSLDEEGGDVTRLDRVGRSWHPGAAALGRLDRPGTTEAVFTASGRRLSALGIDLTFAPVGDVNVEVFNPVIGVRSFGADPARVAVHTAAAVRGLQGAGVAACVKHFPGHGSVRVDSHLGLPVVDDDLAVLSARDLPPFLAALDAGVASVMIGHLLVSAIDDRTPASVSPLVIGRFLRRRLQCGSTIVTDALDMAGVASRFDSMADCAIAALEAGADTLILGADLSAEVLESTILGIARAVDDGRVEAASVRAAGRATAALRRAARLVDPDAAASAAAELAALGTEVARATLGIDGPSPTPQAEGLVLAFESAASIAVGAMPWGVVDADLPAGWSVAGIPNAGFDVMWAAAQAALAAASAVAGRPIRPVAMVRERHRHEDISAVVDRLIAEHDAIELEMGVPAPFGGVGTRLRTYGAGAAQAVAAVEVLTGTTAATNDIHHGTPEDT